MLGASSWDNRQGKGESRVRVAGFNQRQCMTDGFLSSPVRAPADVFTDVAGLEGTIPIRLVGETAAGGASAGTTPVHQRWLDAHKFVPAARKQILLPGADGSIEAVVLGAGNGRAGEPSGSSDLLVGQLAASLPAGSYRIDAAGDPTLMAIAWGLGAYRYQAYKTAPGNAPSARLAWPEGVDRDRVLAILEGVWQGRDLINTPASDLGPEELEVAARSLAHRHGADVAVIAGDELLTRNFPMIHAVGRASDQAPRLIDMTWTGPGASGQSGRTVTLVGKGVCFDTGGLDIKPSAAMLLMKKDMGGAATALALGHMIMAQGLAVRLRILIPAVENAIAGNAFRPSDVLQSRLGKTVEVGNTDAEGRLVLADALALADEEAPGWLISFATLTGAARVALGPDLPALFSDDDGLAERLVGAGFEIGDPMWRLPLWTGYERNLDSEVADMGNVSEGPFAGAVTAALFLRRFVSRTRRFAHIDLYGWRPAPRPLGPKGGEPQTARAVFAVLEAELTR